MIEQTPDLYYQAVDVGKALNVKYSKVLYDALYGAARCKTCGKEPAFISVFQGYKMFCSNKCQGADPSIQEKKKRTCRATTGHDYPMQSKRVREKSKKSVQKAYGVDNVSQSKAVLDKKRKTWLAIYGADNPSKNPEIRKLIGRRRAASMSKKKVVGTQGKQYILQGYEPQALAYMRKFVKCRNIHCENSGNVPTFEYYFDGRDRTYFPDFLVNSNLIVEVKSAYTLCWTSSKFRAIKAKAKAVESAGFKFRLLVMKSDGTRIKIPSDWRDYSFREIKALLQPHFRK